MDGRRKELRILAKEFKKKFNIQVSFPRLLAVLTDYPCMRRCLIELRYRPYINIDHYYLERHEFVRKLLLDTLRLRLLEKGYRVSLKAEKHSECGSGDIDLEYDSNNFSVTLSVNSFKIRLEVKGGAKFSIAQLFRYLLDSDAVVVCMAGRGSALTLTKRDAKPIIEHLLNTVVGKLRQLINGDETRIPGPWCQGCLAECDYAKPQTDHMLDLNNEFVITVRNWGRAIEQTVEQVIELLKKVERERVVLERETTAG